MDTKTLFTIVALLLHGCSWVDDTGSQSNTGPEISEDQTVAELVEGQQSTIKVSDEDQVVARFTLLTEGTEAAESCGDYLPARDSASSLRAACQPSVEDAACALGFSPVEGETNTYRFTVPALRDSVAASYRIEVEDINGDRASQTRFFCMLSENAGPTAIAHNFQVNFQGELSLDGIDYGDDCQVLGGSGLLRGAQDDFDIPSATVDGPDCLWAALEEAPNRASAFSIGRLGELRYVPDPSLGPGQSDRLRYTVTDGALSSEPATVTITVVGENRPPVIADSLRFDLAQGGSIEIDAADLGTDPEGGAVFLSALSNPSNGEAALIEGGSGFSYRPDSRFSGEERLRFELSDPAGAISSDTLTLNVLARNQAPTIDVTDTLTITVDGAPQASVLRFVVGDLETDAPNLRVRASIADTDIATVGPPSAIDAAGRSSVVITPNDNGQTTLSLTVTDTGLSDPFTQAPLSTTARVSIRVRGLNDAPVARDASRSIIVGGSATIDLSTLASDPDGDTLSFALLTPPDGATLSGSTLRVNGTREGQLVVNYRATDPGGLSDTGTVTVTVGPVPNQKPVAGDASRAVIVGDTVSIDLNDIADDPDGDTLEFALIAPPSGATLSGSTLRVRGATEGTLRVRYRATDPDGESDTGTVTVTVGPVPNRDPVAGAGRIDTTLGTPASLDLNTIADDPDGDTLRFELLNAQAGVALSGSTLTARATAEATLTVRYRAVDTEGLDDTGTVAVTVGPAPNRDPVAGAGRIDTTLGTPASLDLNTIADDPDGDTLRFELLNAPAGVALSGSTLTARATAENSFTVDYRAVDPEGLDDTGTVTVTIGPAPNRAPTADDTEVTIAADETATVNLATLANDPDGDTLIFALDNPPAGARLTGTRLRFAGDSAGRFTIDYTATDPGGLNASGTVTVVVEAAPNTPPVANNATESVTAGETLIVDLAALTEDADGDALTHALTGSVDGATLSGASLRYSPAADLAAGTVSIGYSVSDGQASDQGTVSVAVQAASGP